MKDHPHTIHRWDDATGENLIEQIAAVGDYLVALETYRAAVKRWPKDKITLRNRAAVFDCLLPVVKLGPVRATCAERGQTSAPGGGDRAPRRRAKSYRGELF